MLTNLRGLTNSRLAKPFFLLLMLLLVGSFALWGVADVFRGFRSNVLIVAGDTEVTAAQFQTTLQRAIRTISNQFGRVIGMEDARSLGLPRQVISSLASNALLDDRAKDMGLGISDDALARSIAEDPTFADASGRFDRNRFVSILRENGLTEDAYVEERRASELRRQLTESIAGGTRMPNTMIEALFRYQSEKRSLEYVVLPASSITLEEPDEATLKAFYEANTAAFRAPEYRDLTYLVLDPDSIARPDDVTEEEIRAEYERASERFTTPERRRVLQMTFPSQEEAEAALEQIRDGKSFEDVAKERGLTEGDYDLGTMAKSDLIDPAVADAAFSLEKGATSDIVKGRFGPVIVKVTEVEPQSVKPLSEVTEEIRASIATRRAQDEILNLYDAIEDARAGGATFEEIAERFSLPLGRVTLAQDGTTPDGPKVADLPQADRVINGAFESDVGVENDPVEIPGDGYLWYEVTDIKPARERPFDEVKEKVAERWREEETRKRLVEQADAAVEALKAGKSLADIAGQYGATVESAENLTRSARHQDLSPSAIRSAFAGPKGHVGQGLAANSKDRVVFRVTAVETPAFFAESAEARAISEQTSPAYAEGLVGQYIGGLEQELGVRLNQTLLNQILPGS